MNCRTGPIMQTALAFITTISVVLLIAYGLFLSASTSAGIEETRLSRAEFILKADRICKNYYRKAGPIAWKDVQTFAGQTAVFNGVKPLFNDAIEQLEQLGSPTTGDRVVARYIGSLKRSSSLIDDIQSSASRNDLAGNGYRSEEAMKEVIRQKTIAMNYGFKVCSVGTANSEEVLVVDRPLSI